MKIVKRLITFLVYVFLYAPLIIMVLFSFNSGRSTMVFEGFSLKWYSTLLSNNVLMECLQNSLILAVTSSVIATVLGTLAAVGVYRLKNKYISGTIMTVNNIPMMNPDIVTGVSLMLLFVFVGTFLGLTEKTNFWTLLIAHITFNIPYVLLNVLPKLKQIDKNLVEAAMDLGCTPNQAFFKVVLPQINPGIMSGLLMAFTLSFDDFVISYYTSGTDFRTLPLYVYDIVKKPVKPNIYALYSIIFILILLVLIINNFVLNGSSKKESSGRVKKIVSAALAVVVLVVGVFAFRGCDTTHVVGSLNAEYSKEFEGTTLNVYNWGEYISDGSDESLDVIAAFEQLTGINVNYITYESNEVMYSKLKSNSDSYDIIIPSDYMIERLKNEGILQKLDFSQITHYDNIDEKYKNLYFDENNEYSVPYSVGMVGLIYNTTMVEEVPTSWNVLWDERYSGDILTFNNSRDAFAIAQKVLGQSFNTENKADWDAAADLLKKQNSVLQGRVMDQVFEKMEGGNAALAPYYVGDFLIMQEENEDLDFVFPEEGVNVFVDSICVPSCAKNYDAAMMFINFLLEPEVGLANAEYIGYASPNTAVVNHPDYSYKDNEYLYPSEEDMPGVEYFYDLPPEIRNYYENLWVEITSS
ncbi:MAG: extracellular solute-binding protein [Clostridia bacterium]|nr:extracellular solute-binding protein [Clostridia bacterium]